MSRNSNQRDSLLNTRNMGIVAHVDAGKTTSTERILFYAGETHKIGDVDDGNTVTDHMAQEKERGITICAAAVTCHWKGCTINLIDTPGHVDFTMEVERSMRVLDGVVVVICGKGSVQPQTRTVWNQAVRHRVPRVIFVNKMDATGANFRRVVEAIKSELKAKAAVLQLPLGEGADFTGVIDVLAGKALIWDSDDATGSSFETVEIPESHKAAAQEARKALVEAIADTDDALLEKYLSDAEITGDELQAALRKATLAMKLVPVVCGSAFKKRGVQPLLDAIVDYLPSPLEIEAVKGLLPDGSTGERKTSDAEPLAALDFKVVGDVHGNLHFVRVYSGKLTTGSYVFNPGKNTKERVSRLVKMQGNRRIDVQELHAGDIGVCIGLKSSTTGDTLCDENHPIVLETITCPDPVISMAVEAKTGEAEKKMVASLARLATEDPSFRFRTDSETGQVIISGQGELHLEIMVDRMFREDNVEVRTGKPQVSYRETVRGKATATGEIKRQNGGHGMFGNATIEIEPLPRKAGFVFEDAIVGGTIPREFIPAVEKGIREALQTGALTGSPVVDVKVTLVDGKYHDVDSSAQAFQIAGSLAFKEAVLKAGPVVLEPMMALEVIVEDTYMGNVMGDISQRRGRVLGIESNDGSTTLRAHVPLAEMFQYSTTLRGATKGQGLFTLPVSHYEAAPREVVEEITSRTAVQR